MKKLFTIGLSHELLNEFFLNFGDVKLDWPNIFYSKLYQEEFHERNNKFNDSRNIRDHLALRKTAILLKIFSHAVCQAFTVLFSVYFFLKKILLRSANT